MNALEAAEAKIDREEKIRTEINHIYEASNFRSVIVSELVELVERYIDEEREACADEAERHPGAYLLCDCEGITHEHDASDLIAIRIRARGTP